MFEEEDWEESEDEEEEDWQLIFNGARPDAGITRNQLEHGRDVNI